MPNASTTQRLASHYSQQNCFDDSISIPLWIATNRFGIDSSGKKSVTPGTEGYWEGRHWRPDAALWRQDWSIKPAGKMWKELVFKTWWTDQQRTTDVSGFCELSVFQGDHTIIVEHAGREVTTKATVDKSGRAVTIRLSH
ncbi:MAG: hypothetical protein HQ567_07645 [Candidatus Nealsonbacteria bacterium]|nr:hypothetical protein [Candidatus Nealsonbacteria bacterium]